MKTVFLFLILVLVGGAIAWIDYPYHYKTCLIMGLILSSIATPLIVKIGKDIKNDNF